MHNIYIFGLGFKPFTIEEEVLLKRVSQIYLFPKTLEILKGNPLYSPLYEELLPKITVIEGLKTLKEKLDHREGEIALLASGDPLFFGLAESLFKFIPKERIFIFPDLSTLQVFSARLKIPFHQVKPLSFHGRALRKELFLREVSENPYLFVFTDPCNTPQLLSKLLFEAGLKGLRLYVGERLGTPEERITTGTLEEIMTLNFKEPNVLIIENPNWGKRPIFGLTIDDIEHKRGLITKDEVRAVILHKLKLPRRGVIWDIGAGSGSISLEVAGLSPFLKVYAIERDPEQVKCLKENCKKFLIPNLEIIQGEAPEVLKGLPFPDRVFLGGSGGKLEEILEFLKGLQSLKIFIATFVSLTNLVKAIEISKEIFSISIVQLQVSSSSTLRGHFYLRAGNPIFILKGVRDDA